jgi:hypothetical protein
MIAAVLTLLWPEVAAKTLLLLDRGFDHFSFWQQLIEQEIHFITR